MYDDSNPHLLGRLSFISLAAAVFFTSLRHVYRFGWAALLFNLVTVALALLLLWDPSKGSPAAMGVRALLGAWVGTAVGRVQPLRGGGACEGWRGRERSGGGSGGTNGSSPTAGRRRPRRGRLWSGWSMPTTWRPSWEGSPAPARSWRRMPRPSTSRTSASARWR